MRRLGTALTGETYGLHGWMDKDKDNISDVSPTHKQQTSQDQTDDAAADSRSMVAAADSFPPSASELSYLPPHPIARWCVRSHRQWAHSNRLWRRGPSRATRLSPWRTATCWRPRTSRREVALQRCLGRPWGCSRQARRRLWRYTSEADAKACLTPPGDKVALPSMNVIEVFIDEY